jgi:hypothetical protein
VNQLPLGEWIRQTAPRHVTAAVLESWAAEADALCSAKATGGVVSAARSEGARKAWEKRRLPGPPPAMASAIALNVEQRELISQAIERVREMEEDPSITEGRAIEFISADFLSGV